MGGTRRVANRTIGGGGKLFARKPHQFLVFGAFVVFLFRQYAGHEVVWSEVSRDMRAEQHSTVHPAQGYPLAQPSSVIQEEQPSPPSRGTAAVVVDEVMQLDAAGEQHPENTTLLHYYRSLEELQGRSSRFPSVTERLKVYLSTWYVPPCPNNPEGKVQYAYIVPATNDTAPAGGYVLAVQEALGSNSNQRQTLALKSTIDHSRIMFVMDRKLIQNCTNKFCKDTSKYVFPSLDRIAQHNNTNDDTSIPTILQFGDAEQYRGLNPATGKTMGWPNVPVVKKFRFAMNKTDLERVTSQQCYSGPRELSGTARVPLLRSQAIVSIVSNYERHFGNLHTVPAADIAWELKRNAAVWRGALTGKNRITVKRDELTEEETCVLIPRCNFVMSHGNSSLVDAHLVPIRGKANKVSDTIRNVSMFGDILSYEEMLKYKAVVMLEGNDLSSGFKWAMFSDSVVFTPELTCTSWAMEELLEPWVHYIPIADDFSDVEDKVQWLIDNDAKAREIARRGRLWITDLVFHPDARSENELVIDETLRRYQTHFKHNPDLTLPDAGAAAA